MFHPKFAALVAFTVSFILIIGKSVAWFFSGSSTVLASLTDSIQDSILSATNFLAIRYAMQPADTNHRYGHGKMEGIAALGQAAFILGSCVYIFLDSIRNFSKSDTVEYPFLTIGVIIGAIILNGCLVAYQKIVIKKTNSLAIEADSAHYAGDIGIHLGVIFAILADIYLGWTWADPVIAIGIALWLARLALIIGKKAVDMLMDRELPEEERDNIKSIIQNTPGVLHYHDLRTHRNGPITMMSFDIEVEPTLSFTDAHNIAKRVEERLHKDYPKSEVMIHVDPYGDITDSRHKKIKSHHVK